MPTYRFYHEAKDLTFEINMPMAAREQYLTEHPELRQMPSTPLIHSGRGMKKPDDGFRDVLREIKKKNSRGLTKSTINTFAWLAVAYIPMSMIHLLLGFCT
jgi:hypothetical protein